VAKLSPVIAACLSEAMGCAESGVRPARLKPEVQLADELLKAFESEPELAAAFDGLTPGRQKSYVIHLNSAKRPETKVSRIANFRAKILAGKGAMERGRCSGSELA
jgi:uncharacterized protein YdeI (YjbR/CyaY-like superfamily)